jgi:DNA-binding MarR family transcriptional regulator
MDDSIKPGYELDPEQQKRAGKAADAVRCFRLIAFVGQRLRYLMDERLRTDGLTSQQAVLLTIVGGGSPTLGEVARAMSTTHQNVKQIATALERKGMLAIVPDPADARVRRLMSTEVGRNYWRERDDEDFDALGGWFSALDASEQRELADLLARLARSFRSTPAG